MTIDPETLSHDGSHIAVYRDAPSWEGRRTAALGKFKLSSQDSGTALIAQAAETLKNEGFEALIGPMDGDTWHSYRAVIETDGTPPFPMEPVSGPHDADVLSSGGFVQISRYVSTRTATEAAIARQPPNPAGLEVVTWDGGRPEQFFGEVYDFSIEGFAKNAFYKPITREVFLQLYMPYVDYLRRDLILFARTLDGRLAGFLFGIPDYGQGPSTSTAILKTYASGVPGAGFLLADTFHRTALAMGLTTTIHALIHEDNASLERSRKHGAEVFRRYALFGRQL